MHLNQQPSGVSAPTITPLDQRRYTQRVPAPRPSCPPTSELAPRHSDSRRRLYPRLAPGSLVLASHRPQMTTKPSFVLLRSLIASFMNICIDHAQTPKPRQLCPPRSRSLRGSTTWIAPGEQCNNPLRQPMTVDQRALSHRHSLSIIRSKPCCARYDPRPARLPAALHISLSSRARKACRHSALTQL